MGILSAVLGHASAIPVQQLQAEFGPLLVEGEELALGFRVIRDMFVFTTKRLILVDKQGMTGSKASVLTVPYSKITTFSKVSAGLLDLDAELNIWIQGQALPIHREFHRDQNINAVYQILSQAVLTGTVTPPSVPDLPPGAIQMAMRKPGVHLGCPSCGKTISAGDASCGRCGQVFVWS